MLSRSAGDLSLMQGANLQPATGDDSASYPPRPGLNFGVLRGTITFNAVRLVAGAGGAPVETTDTIAVRATFANHWYHYIYPNVSVTLGGGPLAGTSTFTTAVSSDDGHGGRFLEWESDFGAAHTFPHAISQELRIAAPSVGTFPLTPLTPPQFRDPAQWPAVYTALFYRDDPRLGLSTGGTLTVTDYLAPTDEFYGEIHGTLSSRLALWSDATTLSGDTTTVAVTFAVQLWPLGGIPNAATHCSPGATPTPPTVVSPRQHRVKVPPRARSAARQQGLELAPRLGGKAYAVPRYPEALHENGAGMRPACGGGGGGL